MDIARGGNFVKTDKKAKARPSSTRSEQKNKEPQSKITQLKELAKFLYRNDFTRSLVRDTTLFVVAIVGFRLIAAEMKAEAISPAPPVT